MSETLAELLSRWAHSFGELRAQSQREIEERDRIIRALRFSAAEHGLIIAETAFEGAYEGAEDWAQVFLPSHED